MSTIENPGEPLQIVKEPLSLQELGEVLVRHYELHDGLYDVMLEYQFGIGAFAATPDEHLSGVMMAIKRVGLTRAEKKTAKTVDAAVVNPRPKDRKSKSEVTAVAVKTPVKKSTKPKR